MLALGPNLPSILTRVPVLLSAERLRETYCPNAALSPKFVPSRGAPEGVA